MLGEPPLKLTRIQLHWTQNNFTFVNEIFSEEKFGCTNTFFFTGEQYFESKGKIWLERFEARRFGFWVLDFSGAPVGISGEFLVEIFGRGLEGERERRISDHFWRSYGGIFPRIFRWSCTLLHVSFYSWSLTAFRRGGHTKNLTACGGLRRL